MSTSLKHALNPSFALLFAVGVERFYAILDSIRQRAPGTPILIPSFYLPISMVLLTLYFGILSSITNDQFVEANPEAKARSKIALLSYASVFVALAMFYPSVDLALAEYWWGGYGALCVVNAAWNQLAVRYPDRRHYVGMNLVVALIIMVVLLLEPGALSTPRGFGALLIVVLSLKLWHRHKKRVFITV
jgi:hypothetical protein